MGKMEATFNENYSTLRGLAHSLDCLVPDELSTLTGWSSATLEAYRKRGKGPAFVKVGKHYLYPRSAITEFLAENIRIHALSAKAML